MGKVVLENYELSLSIPHCKEWYDLRVVHNQDTYHLEVFTTLKWIYANKTFTSLPEMVGFLRSRSNIRRNPTKINPLEYIKVAGF